MRVSLENWWTRAFSGVRGVDLSFGLTAGMELAELTAVCSLCPVPGTDDLWVTQRVPKGWPDFERYTLQMSPTTGLCKLVAETPVVVGDADGRRLREQFDALARRIGAGGRRGRRYDVGQRHGVLEGSQLWMTALHWGQSALTEVWSGSNALALGRFHAVALRAKAVGPNAGAVELMVELPNFAQAIGNRPTQAASEWQLAQSRLRFSPLESSAR